MSSWLYLAAAVVLSAGFSAMLSGSGGLLRRAGRKTFRFSLYPPEPAVRGLLVDHYLFQAP
jgi:protoheme IX farnesyltransferase